MRKYPKIFRIGTEETKEILTEPDDCIYIEEKIDGANVRFQIQGGELVLGSRNVILDEPKHQWSKIYDYLFQRFKKMELINEDGLICIPNSYVFFGEFCIKHSINYDWEKMPLFLGFDIWDEEKGIFLSAEKARYIFSKIGLEFVPIVDILQVREISKIDENMIPMSKFYNGKAEGIVLKNYNKQIFAKFVTESFKEVNKKTFGGSKKTASDDNEKFVFEYATNRRIEKMIYRLINEENEDLHMKMMKKLPSAVFEDIFHEEISSIKRKNYTINFKTINKMITNRCRNVLNLMIAQVNR